MTVSLKNKKKLFFILIFSLIILLCLCLVVQKVSAPKNNFFQTSSGSAGDESKENLQKNTKTNPAEPKPSSQAVSSAVKNPNDILVVVNKKNRLPINYTPDDLISIGNGQSMRAVAAKNLNALLSDSKKAGVAMFALSGFRSESYQANLYNSYKSRDGQAAADRYSARPGYSEHQTGLVADLGNGTCNLDGCFANTPAGKWLAKNAHKYGFIIRYPNGKESLTGYIYEPWHIRYVGVAVASKIYKSGQTLEQYLGLPPAPSY